mgnify:FL=1
MVREQKQPFQDVFSLNQRAHPAGELCISGVGNIEFL